jgi:hypothetical protein
MPCNASYARFIFGKFFTSTIIWYAFLYALLFAQKIYSCKKWVLQTGGPWYPRYKTTRLTRPGSVSSLSLCSSCTNLFSLHVYLCSLIGRALLNHSSHAHSSFSFSISFLHNFYKHCFCILLRTARHHLGFGVTWVLPVPALSLVLSTSPPPGKATMPSCAPSVFGLLFTAWLQLPLSFVRGSPHHHHWLSRTDYFPTRVREKSCPFPLGTTRKST